MRMLFAVFSLAIAACTAHYFYFLLWRPTEFHKLHRVRLRQSRWAYPYAFAAWFGTGYMIYAGALATLSWIPRSWIVHGEDGPEWLAHSLALIIAFIAGMFVVGQFEEIAKKLADGERDAPSRRSVTTD